MELRLDYTSTCGATWQLSPLTLWWYAWRTSVVSGSTWIAYRTRLATLQRVSACSAPCATVKPICSSVIPPTTCRGFWVATLLGWGPRTPPCCKPSSVKASADGARGRHPMHHLPPHPSVSFLTARRPSQPSVSLRLLGFLCLFSSSIVSSSDLGLLLACRMANTGHKG